MTARRFQFSAGALCLALATTIAGCGSMSVGSGTGTSSAAVGYVAEVRAEGGLPSLKPDAQLEKAALQQAKYFREMVDVTGIIVTKLDSSAKGGMVFSIYNELKLPVHYIGLGEGMTDLVLFQPDYFVNSLFDEN